MAHIYPSAKGWRFQAVVGYDPATNKPRKGRRGPFPTKREAERAAADLAAELRGGAEFTGTRVTLAEFLLDEWLPTQQNRTKATTFDGYDFQARTYLIPRLGHVLLQDLRTRTVVMFITTFAAETTRFGKPRSPFSVRAAHKVLTMALEDARRWGYISRNPAIDARSALPPAKRDEGKVDWWTIEQLRYWLELVKDHRLYALWLLLITTGMRRSEAAGIQWPDIDWNAGSVTIQRGVVSLRRGPHVEDTPKSGSARTVPLDPLVMRALREHRARQAEERALLGSLWRGKDFVFTGVKGGPIRPDRIYDEFKALQDESLPNIALHGLRKSYVTAARVAEARSDAVADIVGHSSDRTTKDIYQRPDPRVVATATTQVNRLLLGDFPGDSGHPQTALDHGPALLEPISPAELEAVAAVLDIVSAVHGTDDGEAEGTSNLRVLTHLVRQAHSSAAAQAKPRVVLVPLLDAVLSSDYLATDVIDDEDWAEIQNHLIAVGWHTTAAALEHRPPVK
jgi:integrase